MHASTLGYALLQPRTAWHAQPRLRPRKGFLVISSSQSRPQVHLGPALLAATGVAAATALAVTWHRRHRQHQQQPRSSTWFNGSKSSGDEESLPQLTDPRSILGSFSNQSVGLPLPGGWMLARKPSIDEQLEEMDAQHYAEAVQAMQQWDARFELRSRSLPELRQLAQQHKLPGRSKMRRKQELIAALERHLGHK